jgi:hypothetical protein
VKASSLETKEEPMFELHPKGRGKKKKKTIKSQSDRRSSFFFFLFYGTRVGTQSLHLEPLHQPYFCDGFFSR